MFAKHIDREEGKGILLYINNTFGASEVEMDTTFEENLLLNNLIQKLLGSANRGHGSL